MNLFLDQDLLEICHNIQICSKSEQRIYLYNCCIKLLMIQISMKDMPLSLHT